MLLLSCRTVDDTTLVETLFNAGPSSQRLWPIWSMMTYCRILGAEEMKFPVPTREPVRLGVSRFERSPVLRSPDFYFVAEVQIRPRGLFWRPFGIQLLVDMLYTDW